MQRRRVTIEFDILINDEDVEMFETDQSTLIESIVATLECDETVNATITTPRPGDEHEITVKWGYDEDGGDDND